MTSRKLLLVAALAFSCHGTKLPDGPPVPNTYFTAELTDTLHLQNCWFERAPYLGALDAIGETGSLTTREFRYTRDGFELSREGVEIPVRSGDRIIGRFVLLPTPGVGISKDDRLIALALADQVGIVLGRAA